MTAKKFSLSTNELGWRFFHRLMATCLLTAPFLLFVPILQSKIISFIAFVVLLLCVLLVIWLPFFEKVREIIIHDEEVQFISFLRTSTVKLTEIDWVEDVRGGLYTQVRSGKEWFLVIADIEGWDEVIATLYAANPEMIIKRISKPRDLAASVGTWVVVIVIISGLYFIGGQRRFSGPNTRSFNSAAQSDLLNLHSSQKKYYQANETYADSIESLGYQLSKDVTAFILSADERHYEALFFHRQGDRLYVLEAPEGVVTEYLIGDEGGEAEILSKNNWFRHR